MRIAVALAIAASLAAAGAAWHAAAHAQGVSLPWPASPPVKGYNSTTRLIAGALPGTGEGRKLVAGIEIRMGEGWKTYWRHPGDAGGVPPSFDWSASSNLASARVLFPVPERLVDPNGQSVGYKKQVVFPAELQPADASKPVTLRLHFEYGICREICVPAEAKIELVIPPTLASMPPDLAAALARVPVPAGQGQAGPALKSASATLSGAKPGMIFDIAGGPTEVVDLFVEAPDGVYLPMTERPAAAAGGVRRFRIDLKGIDDVASLKGKPLRLTIVTAAGGSEVEWVVR